MSWISVMWMDFLFRILSCFRSFFSTPSCYWLAFNLQHFYICSYRNCVSLLQVLWFFFHKVNGAIDIQFVIIREIKSGILVLISISDTFTVFGGRKQFFLRCFIYLFLFFLDISLRVHTCVTGYQIYNLVSQLGYYRDLFPVSM